MSVFTVVIIIWVIYQLVISLIKGKRQTPGKFPDPFKFPDLRTIRETQREVPQGSWREQMQQALNKDIMDDCLQVEETKGVETNRGAGITQGIKATTLYEAEQGIGVDFGNQENLEKGISKGSQAKSNPCFSITKNELVQGVIWAEVLGRPRALNPFKGPRR